MKNFLKNISAKYDIFHISSCMEYGWATTIIILSLQDKNLFSEILLWLPVTPLSSMYWLSSGHGVTLCLAVRKAVTLGLRNLARRQTIVTVVFMKTTIVIRDSLKLFTITQRWSLVCWLDTLLLNFTTEVSLFLSQGIGELEWLSPKNQCLFPRDFLSL